MKETKVNEQVLIQRLNEQVNLIKPSEIIDSNTRIKSIQSKKKNTNIYEYSFIYTKKERYS